MNYETYGTYNGKEYRIEIGRNEDIFLFDDPDHQIDTKHLTRTYVLAHSKIVKPEELSDAYYLLPCAEYKGYKTFIAREVGDEYDIWVADYAVAQKLGFDRCDKLAYNKMVKKTDVKVIYEKKPLKL